MKGIFLMQNHISSVLHEPVTYVVNKVIFQNANAFQTWHERLGHPNIWMMRKITSNSISRGLYYAKFSQYS